MLSFFARNRKHFRGKGLCRTNLRLEQLEGRDCPSPVLANVNARLIGTTLVVTGQVQDTNPSSDSVSLAGVASGNAHFLDSAGDFEFISSSGCQAGSLQVIATSGTPGDGTNSESFYVNADNGTASPYITITGITYGHQRSITITGEVIAEDPDGLFVSLGGVVSGSTTTDSNGNFSVALPAAALGNVTAQIFGANGESNVAVHALSVPPPQIDSLAYTEEPGNSFVITGHVNCQDPQGLTVSFGGQVFALDGKSATVGADGWFQITLTIPINDNGTYTAQVTDYWGQQSNVATDQLSHSY
ncbi:MAG TPA: hypothetical protein VKS79_08260 [Gemmataceae bacterium]|nr:hypothetical protein [Gemmataceae bacterium]